MIFNNKLTIILGYTEMILEKVAPIEPLFADLQEIQKAAEHSADLISRQGKLDQGMDFIEKPFTHNELAAKVRTALAGEEGHEQGLHYDQQQ